MGDLCGRLIHANNIYIYMFKLRGVARNNYLGGAGCSRDILKYNSTNFHVIQTTKIENYDDNFSVLCMDTLCF